MLLLDDISSLECYRQGATRAMSTMRVSLHSLKGDLSAKQAIEIASRNNLPTSLPLRVLIPEGSKRLRGKSVQSRTLPPGSTQTAFVRVSDEVAPCSPELMFVLLAKRLAFAQAVLLGYELCGTCAPSNDSPSGITPREPLAKAARLQSFVQRTSRIHGLATARKAIPHIADNAVAA